MLRRFVGFLLHMITEGLRLMEDLTVKESPAVEEEAVEELPVFIAQSGCDPTPSHWSEGDV